MRSPGFWTSHYVTCTDPADVARAAETISVSSSGETLELLHLPHGEEISRPA